MHWIVPYPPGGTTDILARLIGQYLSEHLGQQFIIENKPGGGNNIGTEAVANSPPDGYTMLLVNPANGINATLYKNLNFNLLRDIAPVAGITRVPNVMEVNPKFPAKTVAEFIAYAKANPGKINMASSGNGTSVHMSGELFMAMTGIKMTHVPYRGAGPALTDMIAGTVDVMFDNMPSSIEHIKAGKLRAIAVTTDKRSAALPDVPTVAETVPGYEASAWFGIGVPKGTPAGRDREAQQDRQRGAGGSQVHRAPGRSRRRADARNAGRFRQGHGGRDREVEKGGRVLGREHRLTHRFPASCSHACSRPA